MIMIMIMRGGGGGGGRGRRGGRGGRRGGEAAKPREVYAQG